MSFEAAVLPLNTPRVRAAVLDEERRIRAAVVHHDLRPVITPGAIERHPWGPRLLDLTVLRTLALRDVKR